MKSPPTRSHQAGQYLYFAGQTTNEEHGVSIYIQNGIARRRDGAECARHDAGFGPIQSSHGYCAIFPGPRDCKENSLSAESR